MERVAEAHADVPRSPGVVGLVWRAGVVALPLGAAGIGFGVLTLRLQEHYLDEQAGGGSLDAFTGLLADGSGPRTAWIGYAAAILFVSAVLRLRLGPVVLEITGETKPCERMEEARAGLRAALTPEWRGGIFGHVVEDGLLRVGDPVEME